MWFPVIVCFIRIRNIVHINNEAATGIAWETCCCYSTSLHVWYSNACRHNPAYVNWPVKQTKATWNLFSKAMSIQRLHPKQRRWVQLCGLRNLYLQKHKTVKRFFVLFFRLVHFVLHSHESEAPLLCISSNSRCVSHTLRVSLFQRCKRKTSVTRQICRQYKCNTYKNNGMILSEWL